MESNTIRIEGIQVKDLPQFAESVIKSSKTGQFVPITLQRAIAHANNPYADGDDVGLLVAYYGENEIVGYFGILPMRLRIADNIFKTHWFTTWSVSNKVRGMGVGSQLMTEALKLQKDFLIVGSVHARRVCKKFGFREREPLTYYWVDSSGMGSLNPLTWIFRLVRKINTLLHRNASVHITNPATNWVNNLLSPLTKKIFYQIISKKYFHLLNNFKFKQVSEIRTDDINQINQPNVELYRDLGAINWMLHYPWVLEKGQSETEQMDYFFSDTRTLFKFVALELYTLQDIYQGFVIFSVTKKKNNTVIKTLDYKFQGPFSYRGILSLALYLGNKYQADIIEVPKEIAELLLPGLLGRIFLQKKMRIYQCHPKDDNSPLARAWNDIDLHLYDGDMAFS